MFARAASVARAFARPPASRGASRARALAVRTRAVHADGTQIKVAHILMPAEKKVELDALYERIVGETATLAELAREHSVCPSAQNGGVIGWIQKGQTVGPFEEAVFATPVGSITRCDTSFGSHVVEVLASRDAPRPASDVSVEDLAEALESNEANAFRDVNLIDVREQNEWDNAHISSFTLKPLSAIREWSKTATKEFDPTKPTYVLCAAGVRSAQAASVLVDLGFEEVYNVTGGMYAAAGVKGLVK
jgi:rhodanese-related sulfurtransferase